MKSYLTAPAPLTLAVVLGLSPIGVASLARAQSTDADSSIVALKQLSVEQLMDIEVTSVSREPEKLLDAASAIQVVTNDEIESSGAFTIPDALRLADNLDIAQKGSSDWAISARGFNASVGNKLLVLMDGRSVYTPLFSGVIWADQDYVMEDIDRIEVISGPGGTLWGANAVNGVINITTKSAKDTQGAYAEAGGGTGFDDFAAVRYGGILAPNVYFRVYAKYFEEGAEEFANGTSANDPWKRGQAGFRLDSTASTANTLTLQGDAYGSNTETVPGGEGTPQAEGISSGGNLLGRWTHTFAEDSDMTLQVYYDRTHLGAPFQSSGAIPAGILYDDLGTYDADFQDRLTLAGRNHVVWGLGYRRTKDLITDEPLVAFIPGTLVQNLFSAFIQDEIQILDKVTLTVGSKVEHNDYTGTEFEPSGRLRWNFADNQMVWAAVSRAVRAPSRYDRDLFEPDPAYGQLLAGNSTFVSETLVAYEMGYRAELSSKLTGSASVFYNEYDHIRSLGLTPTTIIPLFFQNNDEAQTYGLELSADYQVTDIWQLHGGYDFLKEWVWTRAGQVDLFNDLNETSDPKNQFSVRSTLQVAKNVQFYTALRWVDSLIFNDNNAPGTVPSYYEMDARIGWSPTKNLELSLVGQNLLHDYHVEFGAPTASSESIGRTIFGKVAWRY